NEAALGAAALCLGDPPLPSRNPSKDQRHDKTARGRNENIALLPALGVAAGDISGERCVEKAGQSRRYVLRNALCKFLQLLELERTPQAALVLRPVLRCFAGSM